jgi:hypothetical protein
MNSLLLALLLAAPVSAGAPSITAAQLTKLREGVLSEKVKHGPTYVPGLELCEALKVPATAKEPYKVKYESLHETGADGIERSFAYSKQADGYMLVLTTKSHIYYLRIDTAGEPVAGASFKLRSSIESMSDRAVAELAERELILWARRADAMPNPL